jgi:hypothetical protein
VTSCLDWSDPAHWNGGRREPCRLCGEVTFLLDDLGRPSHKVCAERAPIEMVEAGRG